MRSGGLMVGALLVLTTGCAHTGVTMFAGEKGEPGAVAVLDPKTGADMALLDKPNSRTGIGAGSLSTKALDPDVAKRRYSGLFAEVPEAPKLFVLYFREGSTELIDESNALVPELFEEMKRRPGVDIQVVGHTDTVGDSALNDSLSSQRAQIVRTMLVSMGMLPDLVRASGRGEREPIEPTGDNVASVFNRRVEVYIK
jgi:outer membrane protein OmpA-like peptidoglycan-associated protein